MTNSQSAQSILSNLNNNKGVNNMTDVHTLIDNTAEASTVDAASILSSLNKSEDKVLEVNDMLRTTVFKFDNFGNPNNSGELELTFDKLNNTIAWNGGAEYKIAVRVISVKKLPKFSQYDNQKYTFAAVTSSDLVAYIWKSVRQAQYYRSAEDILSSLVGTVLIAEWESDIDSTNYNNCAIQKDVANVVDSQKVLRDNAVVALEIDLYNNIKTKKERGGKSAWVEGCLEFATKQWGFALPDKTNTKRAYIGDGVSVMGVSADGSVSMVDADKSGKFFNRHAMIKHISAEVPDARPDALLTELDNDKFAASWGTEQPCLFMNSPLLALAFGDGGCYIKNLIEYTTVKRLDGYINLDLLDSVDTNDEIDFPELCKEVKQSLVEQANANGGLKPNESLTFDGQTALVNNSLLDLEIAEVRVRKSAPINNIVRGLDIEVKTKATVEAVAKLRGQWFKGMTTPNSSLVITQDGNTVENVNILFNDNSVKNRKAMLVRMWASRTSNNIAFCRDGQFRFVSFNDETEKFETGELVDMTVVQADLEAMAEEFVVSFTANKSEVAEFLVARQEVLGRNNTLLDSEVSVKEIDDELVEVSITGKGVKAPVVMAVELSSVPENLSVNRKTSAVLSEFLTTFGQVNSRVKSVANSKIARRANLMAKTISIANNNKVDAIFNLSSKCQFNSLKQALESASKLGNARDFFRALAQRWENGFEIKGKLCSLVVPTHLVSVLGGFDSSGRSFNKTVNDLYAFLLLLLENKTNPVVMRNYALGLGRALAYWKEEVAERRGAFTSSARVFDTHGLKVLASPLAGTETHAEVEVPVVLLSSDNPLVVGAVDKNGKTVKKVADGDVVFFYRNPILDLTPAVVRVVDAGVACDKWTVAVSQSVLTWSSMSDVDGDTLWLVPAKQVGIPNVSVDGGSEMVSELMSHPLVGKQVSKETLSAWRCGGQLEDIVKSRPDFTVENIVKENDVDVIDLANKVAEHYLNKVGLGYSAMFNAYSTFTRKFNNGVRFTRKELLGIKGCSFALYEEFGLSGYSQKNADRFEQLRLAVTVWTSGAKKQQGVSKFLRRTKSEKVAEKVARLDSNDVLHCASQFAAQTVIQAKIRRGEATLLPAFAKGMEDDAVLSGLMRSLTKGGKDDFRQLAKTIKGRGLQTTNVLAMNGNVAHTITHLGSEGKYLDMLKQNAFGAALVSWVEFCSE